MTGDAVVARGDGGRWRRLDRPWWPVLRIAMVVLWVAWMALTLWTAPYKTDVAQARADIASGQVVSYQWGERWDTGSGWGWASSAKLRSENQNGPIFAWRTPAWRVHYVELDGPFVLPDDFSAPDDPGDVSGYLSVEAAALAQAVTAAGLDDRRSGVGPPQPATTLTLLLLALASLMVLVAGPAPVTGTRWYWFWILCGVPYGLGILYWVARERPWSRTVQPRQGPAGRDPRLRWYLGLVIGILSAIAISILMYGLDRLLGGGVVPILGG